MEPGSVLLRTDSIEIDEAPQSIQSKSDAELEAFVSALTAASEGRRDGSQRNDFHASPLWKALQAAREAKQKPPHFEMPMNMARWLRKNRAEGSRCQIVAAEERKQRALAAVVRPIPEGLTIHTRRRQAPSTGEGACRGGDVAQGSSTRNVELMDNCGAPGGALTGSNRATTRHESSPLHPSHSHTATPLPSLSTSPTVGALALPSAPAAHEQASPIGSPTKVIITPRTLNYVASLPKPETYADGIRLVATILESHHRHKNAMNDLEVEKHSIAYRTAARMRVLWADARAQRYEHMLAFLRLCARVHVSEHRSLDDTRIVQLYDGFELCCRWFGGAVDDSVSTGVWYAPSTASDDIPPLEQQDDVLQGFLSLAAAREVREPGMGTAVDVGFEQYLTCLLKDTLSSPPAIVAAQQTFRRYAHRSRSSMLRADNYRQLCNEFSLIPSPIFRSSDQAMTGATFTEMVVRQLPNGKLVDRAIARLVKLGAIPPPPWVREWFAQYSDAGDDAPTVSESKSGGASNGVGSGGKQWAMLAHAVRGMTVTGGEVQGNSSTKAVSSRALPALPPRLRGKSLVYGVPGGTPSTIGESSARAPGVSVDRMTALLRDKGGSRFPDAAATAAVLVTKYDADVDSVLSESEFICAFVDEAALHSLGRW